MVLNAKQRHVLKKFVKNLKDQKAMHTEFVSVYVPSGYDLNKIIAHLQDEQGTASNIKSRSTRQNVQDALERMIQRLRLVKKTPPNGLAIFAGNVASMDGKTDIQVWDIEPPEPMNIRIYRCDKNFVTEYLEEFLHAHNSYALVVLDRRDATLAYLKGKSINVVKKTHSEVPGKFRAGGQSAQRFSRLREGAVIQHFKKVAEHMKEEFLESDIKGIILGGPGTTVNDFMNKDYLTGDLKKKIVGTKDLSYTGEDGLQELLDKSQDLLANEEIADEKKIMQEFFSILGKEIEKVAYGKDDVEKALRMGAVDTLLLSEDIDDKIIEKFSEEAESMSSNVEIISTETREGVQLKQMGGIAAILRYPIH